MTTPIYIKIYNILSDKKWHSKSDFCRPYSSDDRRLREMRERYWLDYEERVISENSEVKYSEYRIKAVYPMFFEYAKKYGVYKTEEGQMSWV